MGNSKLSAIRRITIENIDKVNFSENIYIAQAKSLFYILTEVCPERFLFICFTEHDFGLGRNYKSCVTSLEPYESCEDAIIDAITKSYVYEFSNRKDYISWLIHAIRNNWNIILVILLNISF